MKALLTRQAICLTFLLFSHEAFGVLFGCTWTDSLNFYDQEVGIQTGPEGIVRHIRKWDETNYSGQGLFDIEEVHRDLKRLSEGAAGGAAANFVTASFSFIFKDSRGAPYAINILLEDEEKKKLVFASSFADIAVPPSYRLKGPKKFPDAKKDEIIYTFPELLRTYESRSFSHLAGEEQGLITSYVAGWKKHQSDNLTRIKKELIAIISSDANELVEDFERDILREIDERFDRSQVGSIIDSEQIFFQYLRSELGQRKLVSIFNLWQLEIQNYRKTLFDTECESAKIQLERYKRDSFKSLSESPVPSLEDLTTAREKCMALKELDLCYTILHLHTTRELCACCAASLSSELDSRGLFEQMGVPPTIKVAMLVSCSEKLDGGHTSIRPGGIGKDEAPGEEYSREGYLDFTRDEFRGIVFQKLLLDPEEVTGAEAGETSDSTSSFGLGALASNA